MTDNQINKLPKNWTLKTLGEVAKSTKGKKPINLSETQTDFFSMPYIDIKAFEKKIFREFTDGEKCNLCNEDDILLVWDGARCGFVGRGVKGAIGSTLVKIVSNSLDKSFLFYFLQSNFLMLNTNTRGAGIPHIEPHLLWNLPLHLPPLPEQQKIVQKIESLFTELETGTKALKTALTQLKIYRQAVLNHFLTNDDWEIVKGESLFEYITSGSRGWADYYSEDGAIFLRITNLNFNTFLLDLRENKIQRVNLLNVKEGLRTKVQEGDFLISITGYLGMFAIVPPDFPEAYVNQHIALCRPKIGFDKKFVGYFITSKNGGLKQFNDMQKGATKAGLSLNDIRNLQIPLPSLKIQTQIVSEIEKRMAGADALEASLKAQLINAENLRQSILKRAFEGKLV